MSEAVAQQLATWMRVRAQMDAHHVKKSGKTNPEGTIAEVTEAATEAFLDFLDVRGDERAMLKGAVLSGIIYGTHFIACAARRAVREEETEQQSQQCIEEQWLSEQW